MGFITDVKRTNRIFMAYNYDALELNNITRQYSLIPNNNNNIVSAYKTGNMCINVFTVLSPIADQRRRKASWQLESNSS